MPKLLKEAACTVRSILHGSELEEVLEQTSDEKARLSIYAIDKYDYLFRSTRLLSVKELLSIIYLLDVCRTAHRVAKEKKLNCTPKIAVYRFQYGGKVYYAKGIDSGCLAGSLRITRFCRVDDLSGL